MAELVVALDLPTGGEALAFLDRLPLARWVKVGSVLMTREGPALLAQLRARALSVFLDLKWHDIPNTVAGAVAAARAQHVAMATVHTLGGVEMLRAGAVAAGAELALVGVTVLTSHDAQSFATVVGRKRVVVADEVDRLAAMAAEAGLAGVVCSPKEAAGMRTRLGPAARIVVPGIRRATDPAGDQRRTATAREAAAAGGTHLVIGRPLITAAEPAAVFEEFLSELR